MSWPSSGSSLRWPRAESAIYREVKRWPPWSWSQPRASTSGSGRGRYWITETGRQVLRERLDTPCPRSVRDFEADDPAVHRATGHQGAARGHTEQVRDDAQEMPAQRRRQTGVPGRPGRPQDQVYIRALAVDFFISHLTTVDSWAERTLAEIQGWAIADGKNDRGLEITQKLPVATSASTPIAHRCRLDPARRRRSSGSGSRHRV